MAANGVPPGYRFYPTEEELICFYLRNKLDGLRGDIERVIPVFEVYTVDPWQLKEIHERLCGGAGEGEPWFFFCPRQEGEARGGRPSRVTPTGYWKAAGTPAAVYAADRRAIGVRKTMVFYRGRAPSGTKTTWKMNEYRALQYDAGGTAEYGSSSSAHAASPLSLPSQLRSEFSLCRLYTRSGVLRQFDRRPLAGAASCPGEGPAEPSMATAASLDDDDGSGGSKQQQMQLMERVHFEGIRTWATAWCCSRRPRNTTAQVQRRAIRHKVASARCPLAGVESRLAPASHIPRLG